MEIPKPPLDFSKTIAIGLKKFMTHDIDIDERGENYQSLEGCTSLGVKFVVYVKN